MFSLLCIMDTSACAFNGKNNPIQLLNKIKNDHKIMYPDSTFTLYTFNDTVNLMINNKKIEDVKDFTDFKLSGFSAINDAIGTAISNNLKLNVKCVIIYNTHENASKRYDYQDIHNLTKEAQDTYNWEFIFKNEFKY